MSGVSVPVIAGLAVGIAFVIIIGSLFNSTSPIVQRKFHTDLSIEGLRDRYQVQETIEFNVSAKGYGTMCGAPVIEIIDLDRGGQVILDISEGRIILIVCDADPSNIDMVWTLPALGMDEPLVIDRIGHYKVLASFGSEIAEGYFVVDNTVQLIIEETRDLKEVKAFTDYYPNSEALVYFVTTCATESCETLVRVPSIVEYWYHDEVGEGRMAILRVSVEPKWGGEPVYFYFSCLVEGSEDVRQIYGSQIEQETIVEFLRNENRCPDGRTLT